MKFFKLENQIKELINTEIPSNYEKCVIFYAAYPHDWKQQAGITFVPGIDPEDMPQ